jgi:hypothetical protein
MHGDSVSTPPVSLIYCLQTARPSAVRWNILRCGGCCSLADEVFCRLTGARLQRAEAEVEAKVGAIERYLPDGDDFRSLAISHNAAENATPGDLRDGARILADMLTMLGIDTDTITKEHRSWPARNSTTSFSKAAV